MSLPLSYCADSTAVLSRLRRFYEERPPDMILARLRVPSPFVAAYARGRSAGYVEYPDPVERARFWDGYLREQSVVHDDWVPNAYPSEMDQGLYGGLLGGQTQFLFDPNTGWISSMVAPILKDLAAAAGLRFTEDHPWWARYR
ncbi:hypothetical protein HQ590_04165, partial [bacterium]|nr:hypothetical protein [bacterium]